MNAKKAAAEELTITDAIGRVEQVLADLRSVSPRLVNPDGTPGTVSPSDLIESSWGNAVVNTLNPMFARRAQAFLVTATAVSCPATTTTTINFTTQVFDSDSLIVPSSSMTINLTGWWVLTAHVDASGAWATGSSIRLVLGSAATTYTGGTIGTPNMTAGGAFGGGGVTAAVSVAIYNGGVAAVTADKVSFYGIRIGYS